jgi:hypothetical protein
MHLQPAPVIGVSQAQADYKRARCPKPKPAALGVDINLLLQFNPVTKDFVAVVH